MNEFRKVNLIPSHVIVPNSVMHPEVTECVLLILFLIGFRVNVPTSD